MSFQRKGQILGLSTIKVDIEDTSLFSDYFSISDYNFEFGIGKNSLVINDTNKLISGAEILVEAFDKAGLPLYIEKAISFDSITKRNKFILSFFVYDTYTPGIGKIIIVSKTVDNKTVRWTSNVNIKINSLTESPVNFYNSPILSVTPILTFAISSSSITSPSIITGSFYSLPVVPSTDFDIKSNFYRKRLTDYRIIDKSANFISSLDKFSVSIEANKIKEFGSLNEYDVSFTSSIPIKNVINKTTLQLESPITYKDKVVTVTNGKYKIEFKGVVYDPLLYTTSSYEPFSSSTSEYRQYSYADVAFKNINSFTGRPNYYKIYRKSYRTLGDFELISEGQLVSDEVLKQPNSPNQAFDRFGKFYNQSHINLFWFTSSANMSLTHSDDVFIDGMIIENNDNNTYLILKNNTSDLNRNASYLPFDESQNTLQFGSNFDCNSIRLFKDTDYVLSFNVAILKKNSNDTSKVKFFITSSIDDAKKNLTYNNNKGVLIGEFIENGNFSYKIYDKKQKVDFKLNSDLYGTLVIYTENVEKVLLSDISIVADEEKNFTANTYFYKIPFPVKVPNEVFEIKAEIYNPKYSLVYYDLRTVQIFDPSGSSITDGKLGSTTLDIDVINANYVNIKNDLTITGSIYVDDFTCVKNSLDSVQYFLVWNEDEKRICVITSSALPSSSISASFSGIESYKFTSSFFNDENANITCSSTYAFWHLHTNDDLRIKITSSIDSGSFTIRLVSSGSSNNTVYFDPYDDIQWSGVGGFDGVLSGTAESGSITLEPTQEMVITVVYYNTTSSLFPVKKYSAFVSDLKTPGLEEKTIIPNLYIIGEGDYGIGGTALLDSGSYIFSVFGGGVSDDPLGISNKSFWGWAPVYIEDVGRRFIPLYQ